MAADEPHTLFGPMFARGGAGAAVGDTARLQAMLDAEAALARACARAGLVAAVDAERVAAACRAERFDIAELGKQAARHAQPVVALVAALREAVGEEAAGAVHFGATSQDILDTAAMLVARRALEVILRDARGAVVAATVLARAHARTPILGRTLLQGAVPTTFGLKAAGWAVALAEGVAELEHVRDQVLAVSLGGPAGTLSGYGDCATVVEQAFAAELGLAAPLLPWHADRRRPARVAAALGLLAGQVGKLARDVTLLAQTEVGEAREGEPDPEHPRGGSSSMGHKRNPVAAVSALACAQRVPALVVTMLSSMVGEHERAAGAWQAEWETWGDLLRLTGSATAWARELLEGLEVDPAAMAANLARIDPSSSDEHVRAAAALVDRALHALSDDEEPA